MPGYEAVIWLGLLAPAGTPKAIIEKLNAEIGKILMSPDVRESWKEQGAVPMIMGADAFNQFMRDDIVKWARVVKISGAKVD